MASLKVQFRAAAVLRGAFILQVLGMILNNIALTSAWFFFFERFGSVNGWDFPHFVGTQGVGMLVYGLVVFGSSGIMDTPRHVDTGSMDGFLAKPTSVLAQLCSSKMDVTTLGDMIIGLAATVWYLFYVDLSLAAFALFVISVAVSVVIFLCFVMLLPNVLAFYVFDADRLSRYVGTAFMDGTIYPGGLF
ncbi:MAG TPA: ABC-2 family transporter protein, partial [Candidatus Saccharimonadales bacterium]